MIDTAKLLQRTLGEHVEIESVFEDDTCSATGRSQSSSPTAILNLALNGRDAMPNGGKLVLETGSDHARRELCEAPTATSSPAAMP